MNELSKHQQFISKCYDDAVKAQVEFDVPLLVTLGQAAIESGWGERLTCNNYFPEVHGNGNTNLQPAEVHKNNKRKQSASAYSSTYDCFQKHAHILKENYPIAFRNKNNPDEFVRSMQRDHDRRYCDDSSYTQRLISIMALIKCLIQELKLNNVLPGAAFYRKRARKEITKEV